MRAGHVSAPKRAGNVWRRRARGSRRNAVWDVAKPALVAALHRREGDGFHPRDPVGDRLRERTGPGQAAGLRNAEKRVDAFCEGAEPAAAE